jgi:surface polysaccharide O-acyltransferase-like enzyme
MNGHDTPLGTEQDRTEQRNANLDLIRILACIAVVGLHTLQKDLSVFNSTLYYICGFAVPVFFMASGYILLNRGCISFRYSIRKCCSVLRVVVLWAAIVFMGSIFIDFMRGSLDSHIVVPYVKLVVKSLLQKGILWQFWYFGALMIVYLCVPLLSKNAEILKWIWVTCLGIGCLLQLSSYFIGTPLQSYCIQTFRLWTWIQYFILGGLCGRVLRQPSRNITLRTHMYCLMAATAFVVIYQNIVGRFLLHNLYAEYFYDSIFTVLWVVILFKWIMRLNLSAELSNVIKRLSPLTMGIYIIHPLVIRVAKHYIEIDSPLLSLVYFVAVLLASGMLAGIVSRIPIANKLIKL